MKFALLDGRKMKDKESVHSYLQTQLEIPGYFGQNLDALWDSLNAYNSKMHIELTYHKEMLKQLGNYGLSLEKVLEEVAIENSDITFKVK